MRESSGVFHMADNNPFKDFFTTLYLPNEEKPWFEFSCKSDNDFFIKEFIDMIDNIPRLDLTNQPFIFRGQKNKEWTLKPKLYRIWEEVLNIPDLAREDVLKHALAREYDAIKYFQQRAHIYLDSSKEIDRDIKWSNIGNWIALMQHYNAPTRFLDWTASFYVGLYFAAEDDTTDGAIWILNVSDFPECMDKKTKRIENDKGDEIVHTMDNFVKYGLSAEPRIELYANELLTNRLAIQSAVFSFSYQLFLDHTEASRVLHINQKLPLIKIIIPSEMKKDIRVRLAKINLFAETLFPGIDGLGKAIYERTKLYADNYVRWQWG